jgi:hypothetical protein
LLVLVFAGGLLALLARVGPPFGSVSSGVDAPPAAYRSGGVWTGSVATIASEAAPPRVAGQGRRPEEGTPTAPWLPVHEDRSIAGMTPQGVLEWFWGDRADEVLAHFEASGIRNWPRGLVFPEGRRLGDVAEYLAAGQALVLERLATATPLDGEFLPGVQGRWDLAGWYQEPTRALHDLLDEEALERGRGGVDLTAAERAEWTRWVESRSVEYRALADDLRRRAFDLVAVDLDGLGVDRPPTSGDLFVSPAAAVPSARSQARLRAIDQERWRWRLALTFRGAECRQNYFNAVYTLQLDDDPGFRGVANQLVAFEDRLLAEIHARFDALPESAFF